MAIQKLGKPFLLSTTVVLFGLHMSSWVGEDSSFRVQHVVVEGVEHFSKESVRSLGQGALGKRIFDVDLEPIQESVEALPFVQQALVARLFPSTLEITIVEREPIALLSKRELRPVDHTGFVLPRLEGPARFDLPVLSGVPTRVDGNNTVIAETGMPAIEFISALKMQYPLLYHQTSEFNFDSRGNSRLYLLQNGTPVYLGREDWLEKCERLQTVLRQVSSQPGRMAALDLRFDHQVVAKGEFEP